MSLNDRSSKRICLRNWNPQLLRSEEYSFENLAVHHTLLTEKAPLLDTHIDHLMGKGLFLTCQSRQWGSQIKPVAFQSQKQQPCCMSKSHYPHGNVPFSVLQHLITNNRSWWALLLPCSFGSYSRQSIINQYPVKTLQYISSSVLDTHEPWAIVDSRCKNGLYKISLTRTCIELEATLVVGIGLRLSQVSPCNSSRLPNKPLLYR